MGACFIESVPILTFHKVDASFEWGVTRVTPIKFRAILKFLKEEGYETVSIKNLINPEAILPKKPVILTFDDSYESLYTHAFPMMQEFGFSGTVFVITGFVGHINAWDVNLGGITFRHLTWNQLHELHEAGFEIGSHTVTHPDLTRIDSTRLEVELRRSKADIEDHIGDSVNFISFPFGRYHQGVIDACRQVGYWNGCGFWIQKKDKKSKETFVLERKAYYLFDGIGNLKSKLITNAWTPLENIKLRLINACSHASALVARRAVTKIDPTERKP